MTRPKHASTAKSGNRYGSACGSVKRRTTCTARQRPRKTAPNVSETFESTLSRSMNTAAKPAVSSSDAGRSARSSRLRALIASAPAGSRQRRRASNDALSSRAQRPRLHLAHEVLGVVARAELVVGHEAALPGGQLVDRYAGGVVRAVEMETGGQVVGQATIDRDEAVVTRTDEVDGLRRVVGAERHGEGDEEGDEQAGRHAATAAARPTVALARRARRARLAGAGGGVGGGLRVGGRRAGGDRGPWSRGGGAGGGRGAGARGLGATRRRGRRLVLRGGLWAP